MGLNKDMNTRTASIMSMPPRITFIVAAVAVMLLAGMGVEAHFRPQPSEAEPYHQQVREAIHAVPKDFGDWIGNDERVAQAAMQLLRPNEILSRTFRNRKTGHVVSVLIVHCKDARDLYGHYPPVCYPAHGLKETLRKPQDWYVDGRKIPGMQYDFVGQRLGSAMTVNNFILVPGEIGRDMEAVKGRIGDFTRRFFGAAQLQVVFRDASLDAVEREDIFQQMLRHHMPIIDAIRGDIQ
jgi:hypothetical protein